MGDSKKSSFDDGPSLAGDIAKGHGGSGHYDPNFLPRHRSGVRDIVEDAGGYAKIIHEDKKAPGIAYIVPIFELAAAGIASVKITWNNIAGKDGPAMPVNKYGDNLSQALYTGLTSTNATDKALGQYLTDNLPKGQRLQDMDYNGFGYNKLLADKTVARVTGMTKFMQDIETARSGKTKPLNPDATVDDYINHAGRTLPAASELVAVSSSVRREVSKIDPLRQGTQLHNDILMTIGTNPNAWIPMDSARSALYQQQAFNFDKTQESSIHTDGTIGNNNTPFYNNKDHTLLDTKLTVEEVVNMRPNDYNNWQRGVRNVAAHETRDMIEIVDHTVGTRRVQRQEAVQKLLYSGVEDMLYKGIPADRRPENQTSNDAITIEAILTRNDIEAIKAGKKPASLEEQMKPFTEKMTEESKRTGRVAQWTTDPKQPIKLEHSSERPHVAEGSFEKIDQKFGTSFAPVINARGQAYPDLTFNAR